MSKFNTRKLKFTYVLFSIILLLLGCSMVKEKEVSNNSSQIATEIEVGKTYYYSGDFKLIDEKHFVYLLDEATFKNEKDLEEYRYEQEVYSIYPQIFKESGYYNYKLATSGDEEIKALKLYTSDKQLPNSIEEFLEQYKYEPEELD